jgi:hypothetical protein
MWSNSAWPRVPERRVLKGSSATNPPRNVQPTMTTPRLTVMLRLRFEKSLFAPKKSIPFINGPCIMQAKSDQIGSSDTPDCDDGRRPVAKLDKWVSYQRDARAQFGWTPKSTMASLALQRGCQPCGYPRKDHIQGSPMCLHKPWPIALPPHFPRFHENEAIEPNSPKPPAFNILNQSVCYSIYSCQSALNQLLQF